MKRIAFIISAFLLCGCSQTESTSVSESLEETTATETVNTALTAATETDVESTTAETTENDKFSVVCGRKSVEIQKNDKAFQTIPVDYTPTEEDIVCQDFNNDGFEDLCIAENEKKYSFIYWLYDSESDSFEEAEEFEILDGHAPLFEVTDEGRLLYSFDDYNDCTSSEYIWEDHKLKLFSKAFRYHIMQYVNHSYCFENVYEYDENGEEMLKCRNTYNGFTDDLIETEEMPYYIVLDGENANLMCDGKLVDTISNHNIQGQFDEIKNADCPDRRLHEPVYYILLVDYDGDGYKDVCVPTSINVYGWALTCFYYRFDPVTEKLVEWDTLNNVGMPLIETVHDGRVGRKCDLYCREEPDKVSEYSEYFYIWEGSELKPYVRILHHDITLNEVVGTYEHKESRYKYDENGNEYYDIELPVSSDSDW